MLILSLKFNKHRPGVCLQTFRLIPSPALSGSGNMGIISARIIKAPPGITIKEILKTFDYAIPASALPASGSMGIISACTSTPA